MSVMAGGSECTKEEVVKYSQAAERHIDKAVEALGFGVGLKSYEARRKAHEIIAQCLWDVFQEEGYV